MRQQLSGLATEDIYNRRKQERSFYSLRFSCVLGAKSSFHFRTIDLRSETDLLRLPGTRWRRFLWHLHTNWHDGPNKRSPMASDQPFNGAGNVSPKKKKKKRLTDVLERNCDPGWSSVFSWVLFCTSLRSRVKEWKDLGSVAQQREHQS